MIEGLVWRVAMWGGLDGALSVPDRHDQANTTRVSRPLLAVLIGCLSCVPRLKASASRGARHVGQRGFILSPLLLLPMAAHDGPACKGQGKLHLRIGCLVISLILPQPRQILGSIDGRRKCLQCR